MMILSVKEKLENEFQLHNTLCNQNKAKVVKARKIQCFLGGIFGENASDKILTEVMIDGLRRGEKW